MMKWVWWFIRGIVYSVIIFALLYLFVNLGIMPNLWEGYANMFTINTIIVISVICGFAFVSIHDLFFQKKVQRRRR